MRRSNLALYQLIMAIIMIYLLKEILEAINLGLAFTSFFILLAIAIVIIGILREFEII